VPCLPIIGGHYRPVQGIGWEFGESSLIGTGAYVNMLNVDAMDFRANYNITPLAEGTIA
jgi:hypothetical protein